MISESIKILNFFKENKIILLLFIFSTSFFIYQHYSTFSWDFASYSLNAEYLFSNGNYFEWLRAPLPSLFIAIFTFGFLPFWVGEYLFIIFVSSILLISTMKFAEVFKVDKVLFYILLLNPFLLLNGLIDGTELLSLSFLLLFLSYLFSNQELKSGFSFALACLSRYTCLPYFVLIFLYKNIKKNIISILLFFLIIVLTFAPWFLFNYFDTGHCLTSIANSQALNVKYRDYLFQQPSIFHFLLVGNFLIPFFIFGLTRVKFNRKNVALLIIVIITILSYLFTPFKVPRYLFNLILPLAYFSYFAIEKIKNSKLIFSSLTISIIIISVIFSLNTSFIHTEFYEINISKNCMLASNQWVPLNYFGYISEPFPRKEEVDNYLNEGYRVVIYYGWELDYSTNMSFLEKFPIIEKTNNYIILGNISKCKEIYKVDRTYLERLNSSTFKIYNYSIETNPCKSIGLGKICNYLKFL